MLNTLPGDSGVVIPDTRYTRTPDGFYIAYQVVGQGLIDFAWMPGFILGNVEVVWEHPLVEAFLGRFASIGRLIIHDRRGTGLSDRATSAPGLETRAIDLLAALIAAGSSRTVLIGGGEGGALAAFVAAGRPDLVSALVWWQAQPRSRWAQDYPWGATQEEVNSWLGEVERGWGTESFASAFVAKEAPSLRGDQSVIRWLARMQRHWVTPGSAVELARIWYETDIRDVLPSISVPTLILDREGLATEEQAFTSSLIPAAERVVIPGNDAPPWAGDQESLISAVLRFLQIERSATDHNRVLATVLFTDMWTQRLTQPPSATIAGKPYLPPTTIGLERLSPGTRVARSILLGMACSQRSTGQREPCAVPRRWLSRSTTLVSRFAQAATPAKLSSSGRR